MKAKSPANWIVCSVLGCIGVLPLTSVSAAWEPFARQDAGSTPAEAQQQEVFSGPQAGETLPSFEMTRVNAGDSESSVDVVKLAGKDPLLLIFVHQRTRPAFALMRAVTKFSQTRKIGDNAMTTGVCFLTKDPAEMVAWANRVKQLLAGKTIYGVYPKGIEGPGAYGLNRNVTLTVLVAKEGKVTYNAAIVQPDLQSDGNKILKAIAQATGGGKVPDIRELAGQSRMARSGSNQEPNMRPWLAPVIRKTATDEEVDRAAQALEEHVAKNAGARKAVGRISTTVVNSGKLENYGTPHAQNYLKKWAEAYGSEAPAMKPRKPDRGTEKPDRSPSASSLP